MTASFLGLSFLGGYTVFLGPITGIMVTDLSLRNPFILVGGKRIRIVLRRRCLVSGLYTALMSTFPRCIGLMEGIDIYIPFRSWIVDLSLKTFGELARRRRHDGLSAAHFAGAHQ
jgi:hypothetical protein